MNPHKILNFPATDLVILAGGQARRMNGLNKLLQTFDEEIQLIKIYNTLQSQVNQVWINSHRDHALYTQLMPTVQCFQDDHTGFQGPLMGMKTAWSKLQSGFVLFVPCDVTFIPEDVLEKLHQTLTQNLLSDVAVVNINGQALYPFCLMRRTAVPILEQHLALNQRSLKTCFQDLAHSELVFENNTLIFHSINSLDELQQHRQIKKLLDSQLILKNA